MLQDVKGNTSRTLIMAFYLLHMICLGHKESLSFINPRTDKECSKLGNAYYHINLDCIRQKHPIFTAAQVECPHEIQEMLTEIHYDFLQKAIGYFN